MARSRCDFSDSFIVSECEQVWHCFWSRDDERPSCTSRASARCSWAKSSKFDQLPILSGHDDLISIWLSPTPIEASSGILWDRHNIHILRKCFSHNGDDGKCFDEQKYARLNAHAIFKLRRNDSHSGANERQIQIVNFALLCSDTVSLIQSYRLLNTN